MKVLVLSDIHGLLPNISKIIENEAPDLIILSGDIPTTIDIPIVIYSYLFRKGGRSELIENMKTKFLERLTQLQIMFGKRLFNYLMEFDIPIVAIPGNVETPGFRTWMDTFSEINSNVISLQEKSLVIDEFQLLGFGWVTDSSGDKRNRSFGETHPLTAYRKLSKLGRQIRDDVEQRILVSHAPPYGTSLDFLFVKNLHVGSKPVANFLSNSEIDGIICGHIHESRGSFRSTAGWWGVNAGATIEDSACLINLETKQVKWLRNLVPSFNPISFFYRYRQSLHYNSGFFKPTRFRTESPIHNPTISQRG